MSHDAHAELDPVEVDLICTFAEVDSPFPVRVPSAGTAKAERLSMFRAARERLASRGLADVDGPLGPAEDFVRLLRSGTGALDFVLIEGGVSLGVVVLADHDDALLVVQRADDPHGTVQIRALSLDEAVNELMRYLPAITAANAMPFALPTKALRDVYQAITSATHPRAAGQESAEEARFDQQTYELLREHGISDRTVHRMAQHLQPVLRNGQAGVARHAGPATEWRRVGEELRWLDNQRGRYRLVAQDDWLSVNPLGTEEVRAALRRLASSIRSLRVTVDWR